MNSHDPNNSDVSPFFSFPAEVLEKIFLFLPASSLRRLISATGLNRADEFAHFRQICQFTLRNVDLFDTLRSSHPATTEAIQRQLKEHLRYSRDGEGIQRVLKCHESILREGRYDHAKIALELDAEWKFQYYFDESTDWLARLAVDARRKTFVDVFDEELRHQRRIEIGSLASSNSFTLRGTKLLWIERDTNSIYAFLHLKVKDFESRGETRGIPISKFGFKTKSGVTQILASSRFLVTHDVTQFLVFRFPSLEFLFRREAEVADAALDGDCLFVSNDGETTVWDLPKKRIRRATPLPPALVAGSRRPLFPYQFFRSDDRDRQPSKWNYIVMDAFSASPVVKTELEMETFLRLRRGRGDYVLLRSSEVRETFSLGLQIFAIASGEPLGSVELTADPRELIDVVFCNNFRIVVVSSSQSSSTTFLQYFDFLKPLKSKLVDDAAGA